MREQRKNKKVYGIIFLLGLLWLTSCGKQETEEKTDTGFVAAVTGVFDSADTAVVAEIDMDEKTITLKNMDKKRQYTLTYDGTTFFYDKYGKVISITQLQKGEVVDVTFFRERKTLEYAADFRGSVDT